MCQIKCVSILFEVSIWVKACKFIYWNHMGWHCVVMMFEITVSQAHMLYDNIIAGQLTGLAAIFKMATKLDK